jgi:hypothetical protein
MVMNNDRAQRLTVRMRSQDMAIARLESENCENEKAGAGEGGWES